MSKKLTPWWRNSQWSVIAKTGQGWQEIYTMRKRVTAQGDAKAWSSTQGHETRVVPGPGHKHFRERAETERGFRWTPALAMAYRRRKRR